MDSTTLISTLRHRRRLFLSLLAVSLLILLSFGHPRVRHHASSLWDDRMGGGWEGDDFEEQRREHRGYARFVGGLDGFFVLENVYVKDRRLFLVQDPAAEPLPAVHKIITSTVPETYDRSTLILRLASHPAAAYDPTNPEFDAELAGRWKDNDNFPDVPRLVVLDPEEAARVIPGWSGEDWARNEGEEQVIVLNGTTFYLADDATQIGWGALMHHYFHFVGELLLGTYHAFQSALLDDSSANAPPHHPAPPPEIIDDLGARSWLPWSRPAHPKSALDPARIVIPWTTTWQGKDFDELVVRKAFADARECRSVLYRGEVDGREGAVLIDRTEWTKMNADHRWRLFSRVVITDRNAAHNDYWSQTSRWNKMALDVLSQPLPPQNPPVNFFSRPQQTLAEQLGVAGYPSRRPGTEAGFAYGKGWVPGEVRIVYVDRQGSDRKLDDESNTALLELLDELQRREQTGGMPRIIVEHVKFEDMPAAEQIKTAMRADIWLGIHGNGLTHLVWTLSGATVIELFPVDSFIRDYQLLSTALEHRYFTVWRDRLIGSEDWGTERGGQGAIKLHDGTRIPLDKDFMRDLLEQAVRDMA